MKEKKFMLFLFFVSLILRLFYVLVIHQPELSPDGVEYYKIALSLSSGHGFSLEPGVPTPIRPPLYPLFLAAIYRLGGHSYALVRVIQAFLGAFTCVFIYLITLKMFTKKIAGLAALLYTFYPIAFAYTSMILTETSFTFLFALIILLYMNAVEKNKILLFVLAGIMLGLATSTRGTLLFFPIFLLIVGWTTDGRFIRKWLLLVLSMILIMAPWTIRNFYRFQKFIPVCTTGVGLGLWASGYEASGQGGYLEAVGKGISLTKRYPSDRILYEKRLSEEGFLWIKQNPVNYFLVALKRFPRFWWSSHSSILGVDRPIPEYLKNKNYLHLSVRLGLLGLHGIILVLALIGMVFSFKDWRKCLILAAILVYFTGTIAFYQGPRCTQPAMPFLFIFVSVALVNIYAVARKRIFNNA